MRAVCLAIAELAGSDDPKLGLAILVVFGWFLGFWVWWLFDGTDKAACVDTIVSMGDSSVVLRCLDERARPELIPYVHAYRCVCSHGGAK